jgi:hypothetical protein
MVEEMAAMEVQAAVEDMEAAAAVVDTEVMTSEVTSAVAMEEDMKLSSTTEAEAAVERVNIETQKVACNCAVRG